MNKRNIAASGITETYGEREQLLDECITEIDNKKEEEGQKKRAEKELQLNLKRKGEEIRNIGVTNANSTTDITIKNGGKDHQKNPSEKRKLSCTIFNFDSALDAEMELLQTEAKIAAKLKKDDSCSNKNALNKTRKQEKTEQKCAR